MATRAKKYSYVVYYKDQTYQTIDITRSDFEELKRAKVAGGDVANLSIGFMETVDIRSVFERIDPPKSDKKEDIIAELPPNMSLEAEAFYYGEIQRMRAEERKRQNQEVDIQ